MDLRLWYHHIQVFLNIPSARPLKPYSKRTEPIYIRPSQQFWSASRPFFSSTKSNEQLSSCFNPISIPLSTPLSSFPFRYSFFHVSLSSSLLLLSPSFTFLLSPSFTFLRCLLFVTTLIQCAFFLELFVNS